MFGRTRNARLFTGVVIALALGAARSKADDKDLLYTQRAAAPNVLVVVSNTESMATCIPGISIPNGLTCPSTGFTYGAPLTNDGMGDGPSSKMGIAKGAIASIVTQYPTDFNWGLSSFSVSRANLQNSPAKRWVFQAQSDDFSGQPFNTPSGTLINFGAPIGTLSTLLDGVTNYGVLPWLSAGQASWVQTTAGTLTRQPYCGGSGTGKLILFNLDPGALGGRSINNKVDTGKEIVLQITGSTYSSGETNNGPYRIHYDDGDSFTVTESVYQCINSGT